MTYKFREGSRSPTGLTAEVAGEELDRINLSYGVLRPEDVVEEAKDEDSPLHSVFEWDDSVAADEYRKQQARTLIRSIVVEKENSPSVKRFVHVRLKDSESFKGESAYMATETALADPDYSVQVLGTAKKELSSVRAKYQALKELAGVIKEINKVLV